MRTADENRILKKIDLVIYGTVKSRLRPYILGSVKDYSLNTIKMEK